jgi:BLOC-1 related complex subunit 8
VIINSSYGFCVNLIFKILAAERISENMHIVANEPSLALFRLQEHVRKALPPMVERRVEVTKLQHELQGRCYDVEYALRYPPLQ